MTRALTLATDATPTRLLKPGAQLPQFQKLPLNVKRLLHMLSYKRPAGSAAEAAFVQQYVAVRGARPDAYGNQWFVVPEKDGSASKMLWSSHTDTVHKEEGKQTVRYYAAQAWTEGSNCLGADCAVGVWLMTEMIGAGVPGTYIFHIEEEIGGNGSAWIAERMADTLKKHDFAVAFDRKGTNEIITEQWKGPTASDAFAESLAAALAGFDYKPSPLGSFTDTANYAGLIPECTNIGVGYHGQHTKDEWLDVDHAVRLRDALVTADLSGLVVARDPTEVPAWKKWGRRWSSAKVYQWGKTGLVENEGTPAAGAGGASEAAWEDQVNEDAAGSVQGATDGRGGSITSLEDFCFYEPDLTAEFIAECGFDLDDLLEWGQGKMRN